MDLWLWIVNGVLWLVAAGLISKGIRKLFSGLELMRLASVELTKYVISESTEAADEIERWAEGKTQEIRDLMNKAAAEKSEGKIEALEIELDKGFKKVT